MTKSTKSNKAATPELTDQPSMPGVQASIADGFITLRLPVSETMPLSTSGKTNRVFSSEGNKPLTLTVADGRTITAGLNLYVKVNG